MKPCTLEDFGTDETSAGYYYSWNGFMVMCPEMINKDGKNLTLDGAWGMNQTSRIEFRANRCTSEYYNDCDSEENIDKMLRDMKI